MRAIFQYRNAQTAIDLMNQGESGARQLADHPELGMALKVLRDAQEGAA